jgi:hypothetical protein
MVHVLLELADGFGGEGVRDRLALAGVFSAVAGVEEAAADGDEGVVIFTESVVSIRPMYLFWTAISYLFSIPLP